jgi:hypothetical protein
MNKKLLYLLIFSCFANSKICIAETQYSVSEIQNKKGESITDWIANNQAFSISLQPKNQANDAAEYKQMPQFQILVGNNDISSVFTLEENKLVFKGGIPLPAGENTLIVNQLINDNWQQIGSGNLQIMSAGGFKQAQWTPRLEINVSSQLDERVSGDATASEKPTFSDVSSNIGFTSHHQNDDFSIDSSINMLSVSNRTQAIQFGSKQQNAQKLDLSDYQVSVKKGNHSIVVGHTSYGSNALLIDNLSRRGLSWQYQRSDELSFSGALLNGTDVVGFNNITGLANHSEQYVNSLGFGINTLTESRVSVRIEGTYMDAVRLSQNDFGVSEVVSAEENNGVGFKFTATDNEGLFNGDLTLAISRYTNPEDEFLNFGDELVELETETSMAHNLNLSYILLQEWETPWGNNANLTLSGSHVKADPQYQTLTSFVQANVISKQLGAQYQVGSVSGNIGSQSSQDNLDNLVNILTTKTENDSFSANIPLAQIFSDPESSEQPSTWYPSLDYSFQNTHQFAISSPDASISGFNGGSHLPNQVTKAHNLSASWQLDTDSVSIQVSFSDQDNRQVDRENSDFLSLQHGVSYNLQQSEQTSWSFALGRNRQFDKEAGKIQYNDSATVGFNWQSVDGLALSLNYGLSEDNDSLDEAENTATTADIGLVKNLVNGEWWFPADGSISLRVNYNNSKSIDRIFDQLNQLGTTTALLGINLSFQ